MKRWASGLLPLAITLAMMPGIVRCGGQPASTAASASKFPYTFKVDLSGARGSTGDAAGLVVLGRGKVSVTNTLLYRTTGKPLVADFLKKEKPLLAVYVTNYEPQEVAELEAKEVIHKQSYEEALSFAIPDNYVNQKVKLYLTLVRSNVKLKTTELVETASIEFYVDATGAGLQWVSKAQFIPAAQDAIIPLEVKAVLNGADLAGEPTAEYTVDGTAWKSIAIQGWEKKEEERYSFSVKYPLATEEHFRLRLKAKDTLGNESISAVSANLVGAANLPTLLKVDAAERSTCKDAQQKAASHIDLVLASRVLCRKKAEDGSLLAEPRVAVYVQNRGSVPLVFPTGQESLTASLVYNVAGQDDVRFFDLAHAPFSAADFTGPAKLIYISLDPDRLSSSSITLYFDKNVAGRYSTSGTTAQGNTCYPGAEPVPKLVLQQKGTLDLVDPAVPCSE